MFVITMMEEDGTQGWHESGFQLYFIFVHEIQIVFISNNTIFSACVKFHLFSTGFYRINHWKSLSYDLFKVLGSKEGSKDGSCIQQTR